MNHAINPHNRIVETVNLVSCSQRSHGLAVSESLLTHRVGFLMFLHHDVRVAGRAIFKLLPKVNNDGQSEKDQKSKLPALLCDYQTIQYVIQADKDTHN